MASIARIKKDPKNNTAIIYNGNKKLTDTAYTAYMQYNLDAVKTCPYASDDCLKFCYAKNAERYTTVRNNHAMALQYANDSDFVNRTTATIKKALTTRRYNRRLALFRLHESGDFFSVKYLCDWLDIMNGCKGENITFHFYTKSFKFFIDMDSNHKAIFTDLLKCGTLAVNWSVDYSTTAEQWERIDTLKALYPDTNIYFALPSDDIITSHFTHTCACADCGNCRVCSIASGAFTAVGIH